MPLLEKIKLPVAKLLLQNLVNYLAVKSAEPIKAGLVAPESSPVATAVVRMKMAAIRVNDPKADLRPFGLLVVDPESLRTSTEMTEAVKQYAANGGTVLLKSITPDHAQIVQSLTGMLPTVTALQPHQGFRCETGGLVSGIGQFDLWWRVGDWVEHQDVTKSVAPICHHVLGNLGTAKVLVVGLPGWSMVTPELEKQLKTNSVALAELTVGKGKVILDQVLWEQPAAAIIGFQYAAQLLANLGATVELPLKIQR